MVECINTLDSGKEGNIARQRKMAGLIYKESQTRHVPSEMSNRTEKKEGK